MKDRGKGRESAQPKVKEQIMKERQQAQTETLSEDKRDSFRSVSLVSFLDLLVINEQIRTVLRKCKSAGGEIKPF